jgi:hypothetical protein
LGLTAVGIRVAARSIESTQAVDALHKAGQPLPTAAIVAYVADAIGQGEAGRKVVAKTVATNLRYMAERHKTVQKIGERESACWALA